MHWHYKLAASCADRHSHAGAWELDKEPRPAMGWKGLDAMREIDSLTRELLISEKFVQINQTPWLHSHSGMKIPTEDLYENIIKEEIMGRMLVKGGYGLY